MKRILILGDIHANYPALQAIQSRVRISRFDRILNTGDTTVYSTFPNETIRWFRRRKKSVCVLGNTDRRVLGILRGEKLKKPGKEEKRVMYFWTSAKLLQKNRRYLASLPDQTDFSVDGIRMGVFHGTFFDPEEFLFPDSSKSRFRELAQHSPYRVHIMGHSHTPYHKIVDGAHFINPGSVGRMFDGDPRASFATLTLRSGKITVEHFRIPYQVEKVIKGLDENRLPPIYKKMFRKGRKLN